MLQAAVQVFLALTLEQWKTSCPTFPPMRLQCDYVKRLCAILHTLTGGLLQNDTAKCRERWGKYVGHFRYSGKRTGNDRWN